MTHRRIRAAALATLVACAACDDGGPDAALLAPETAPALAIDAALPTLPALANAALEAGVTPAEEGILHAALRGWSHARSLGDVGVATDLRDHAFAAAAPILAERLDPSVIATYEARLGYWIRIAGMLALDVESIGIRVGEAGARLDEANALRADGRGTEALVATLEAADLLRGAGPEAIAGELIADVRAGLPPGGESDDPTVARAARLLRGAEAALQDGDYERALRRAYYARQLLYH